MDNKPRPPPLSAIWSKLSPWTATSWPLLGAHVTLVPYEWSVPSIKKESGNLIFVEMVVVTIKYRLTELRPTKDNAKTVNNFLTWYCEDFFLSLFKKYFGPLLRLGKFLTQLSSAECIPHPWWSAVVPVVPVDPQPIHSLVRQRQRTQDCCFLNGKWRDTINTGTKGKTHTTQSDRTQRVLMLP